MLRYTGLLCAVALFSSGHASRDSDSGSSEREFDECKTHEPMNYGEVFRRAKLAAVDRIMGEYVDTVAARAAARRASPGRAGSVSSDRAPKAEEEQKRRMMKPSAPPLRETDECKTYEPNAEKHKQRESDKPQTLKMPPMSTMQELKELYDQISEGVKLTDWLIKGDPHCYGEEFRLMRGQRAKQVKQLAQVDALINAKRQEKAKPERGIAASAPIMPQAMIDRHNTDLDFALMFGRGYGANRLHDLHTELQALQDRRDILSRDMNIMFDRDGYQTYNSPEYNEMREKLISVNAKIKIVEERIKRCHLADKGFGGNDVRRRLTGLAARFERHLRQ